MSESHLDIVARTAYKRRFPERDKEKNKALSAVLVRLIMEDFGGIDPETVSKAAATVVDWLLGEQGEDDEDGGDVHRRVEVLAGAGGANARERSVCICLGCVPHQDPDAFHVHGEGNVDAPPRSKITGEFHGPEAPAEHSYAQTNYLFEALYHRLDPNFTNLCEVVHGAPLLTRTKLNGEVAKFKQHVYKPLFASYLKNLETRITMAFWFDILRISFMKAWESVFATTARGQALKGKDVARTKLVAMVLIFRGCGEYIQQLIHSGNKKRYTVCICNMHQKEFCHCQQCAVAAEGLKGLSSDKFIEKYGYQEYMNLPYNARYKKDTVMEVVNRCQVEIPKTVRDVFEQMGPEFTNLSQAEFMSSKNLARIAKSGLGERLAASMSEGDRERLREQAEKYMSDLHAFTESRKRQHIF